jgi:CheY-like chemotaxis protein
MPNMDGIDVCKIVRQNEKMQEIPIIMLSARAHAGDVEAGLAAGATKYLTKPISRKKLLEEVEQALSKTAVWENDQ